MTTVACPTGLLNVRRPLPAFPIRERNIDMVVVYKVDRLTQPLADFDKLVELIEAHGISFVFITQQFNTITSMGRLTVKVLLSFTQFEWEVAGVRIRDKFAVSQRNGMWMGGRCDDFASCRQSTPDDVFGKDSWALAPIHPPSRQLRSRPSAPAAPGVLLRPLC